MTSCTVIISHFESVNFLHACISQIRKHRHPQVDVHILIADQSRDEYHDNIAKQYGNDEDVTVVKTKPLYSGYGIDYIMRNVEIKTDYVCQLHVDAFPIHKNWLFMPIAMIEEFGFVFVGQNQFVSLPTDTIYYNKTPFFSMSACFNIARTEHYKELSLNGGFTRYHERAKVEGEMFWDNNDWDKWAKEDYQARGSDDDVLAFCWEDNHRQHDKLGLAITGMLGNGNEPNYGRIIEGMIFHFGSCRESIGVLDKMGEKYRYWTRRINEGYSEELIARMLADIIPMTQPRIVWNGITKTACGPLQHINNRIEDLKK